jgi:NAD(P)-dependent dehydrogenase (short-subunit alcohol dehydrogenase family)
MGGYRDSVAQKRIAGNKKLSKMFDFTGKKILVTGASSGLGQGCAAYLTAAGAQIIAVARRPCTASDIGLPERTAIYEADLCDESATKNLVRELKQRFGALDGCVLAAGLHTFRPIVMESYADLSRPWAINVQACLGLVAMLAKNRMLGKDSSIVLFSSASARSASPGAVSYAASKGAIEAATYTLALEFAGQRIRVNAVAPGVVPTPMSQSFLSKLTPEQKERLEAHHPLGFGTIEDVVGPVAFLLSAQARWITGVVLPVDGGFSVL